jgi:hypothetical protein
MCDLRSIFCTLKPIHNILYVDKWLGKRSETSYDKDWSTEVMKS